MKRTFDYGYNYAASINATELYQPQAGDDIPEFWAGYNEYIYETIELTGLQKEIKDLKKELKQAIFN